LDLRWFFQGCLDLGWFFLDVGCTRFFGSGILLGFFGFGFFSFADTNIYKNEAEMKLFRLRCSFARRKKRLPDERLFRD